MTVPGYDDPRFYYDIPPTSGKAHGMTGSKWFTCARCGFDYPVKYRRRQDGFAVCTYLPCLDVIIHNLGSPVVDFLEAESELDFSVINDAHDTR